MDGLILVSKQAGWTSFDVVAKVRSLVRQQTGLKKPKVGHCGTLDPLATGLLLIVVGSYCKRAQEFSRQDKEYETEIHLGVTSTTGDEEGDKTYQKVVKNPDTADIVTVLEHFTGEIEQTPPVFSAIKVDGKRAYQLARSGKEVALQPRAVTIYKNMLVTYAYPKLCIRSKVSSGTYIRTLAEDIGRQLGTGGYVTGLHRTRIGEYDVDDASTIVDLEKSIVANLRQVPIDKID